MKNVPAMRTRESSAVFGSPTIFLFSIELLFDADEFNVKFSTSELSESFNMESLSSEQRFSGCSLNICRKHNACYKNYRHVCCNTEQKSAITMDKNSTWHSYLFQRCVPILRLVPLLVPLSTTGDVKQVNVKWIFFLVNKFVLFIYK